MQIWEVIEEINNSLNKIRSKKKNEANYVKIKQNIEICTINKKGPRKKNVK